MLGFRYIQFDAMTYVIYYRNGKIKKEGPGLSFLYFSRGASIAAVPMGSNDLPFIFTETTADFQQITIQGQITYKVADPKKLAQLLDYTVNRAGTYKKNDFEKPGQRLVNEAQTSTNSFIQSIQLKEALRSAKAIETNIFNGLGSSKAVEMLGVEVLSVTVTGIKPTPEMARALEAEARESLQQEADEAVYIRRNFAVEQERKIKESELNTEIAVEEKKREIMETKLQADLAAAEKRKELRELEMATDISVEEQKKALTNIQADNQRTLADAKAYELKAILDSYKETDWKTLMAVGSEGLNPKLNIAVAFRELAENANKIGNLNITDDMLEQLLKK